MSSHHMISSFYTLMVVTFERRDHAWTSLLQEALELLPGSLQHWVVLDVAAQVLVVLFEQTVPRQTALQAVRTEHTHAHT